MRLIQGVTTAATIVVISGAPAFAATVVPGSANPNLAGRDQKYTCCGGDTAASQAPPAVAGLELEACATLNFSVQGRVSFTPTPPVGDNPDGDDAFSMTNFGDGISAPLNVRANALVGVFLDDGMPTGKSTPGQLDYTPGLSFVLEMPGLRQIFFIGDGLTSDTKNGQYDGGPQSFVVPHGATRLFLGTADGSGWYNNTGLFEVSVTSFPYEAPPCGDAASPAGITTSDALFVLRSAVGAEICQDCVCDVDGSGLTSSTDALVVLRKAVGQSPVLRCACCMQLV
jgi:hypothetical protein